jgi:2,3,4,5-tetrahydropyridine-2-carboxylate N-succinyltransferase
MLNSDLKEKIEYFYENKVDSELINGNELLATVNQVLSLLEAGKIKVCEKKNGDWITNTWIKKAILLKFRHDSSHVYSHGVTPTFDKLSLKCKDWQLNDFEKAGFRALAGSIVRQGAFIAPKVVLMPSFVNVGAYVGENTMVDTWSTIGSCAQIGKNCHISGGVGIGGVLEPVQSNPVIIEDNCFIGARSEIAEGVIVEEGAVISMGVFIGASTKIVDRQTGQIHYGRVPAYSVVVSGVLPSLKENSPLLSCAVIVKTVDERTRSKTSINEILRD